MKVGDLVKYQDWWSDREALGIIVAVPVDPERDLGEQDYQVYWIQGPYLPGQYGCRGKYLEVIK